MGIAPMAQSAQPVAEGKASGEVFQYIVTTPVTVKRGESALVPIIGSEIQYDRELLYNGAKLPQHPVAALRFKNTTNLTLERGPVTVVEDGDYKGEAVVPFTKEEHEVYLPYAVELGIKIAENQHNHTETYGIEISGAYLRYNQFYIISKIFTIENTTNKPQTVILELPKMSAMDLYETRNPDVETLQEQRWRVDIPARQRLDFTVKYRQMTYSHHEIRRLSYTNLSDYLEKHWLDLTLYEKLKDIVDALAWVQKLQQNIAKWGKERDQLYKKQEQLRANLGALQPSGQEATLRNRILKQLEESQERLEKIDVEIQNSEDQIAKAEKQIEERIAALS
jgi:hypothetical protein